MALTGRQIEVLDAMRLPDTHLEHMFGRGGYAVLRCVLKPSATTWGRYERVVGGVREATKDRLQHLGLIKLVNAGRYHLTELAGPSVTTGEE